MKAFSSIPKNQKRFRHVTNAERWKAVVEKDLRADGKFYYSVKTTGVYCRPSCPSRLAKRKNVSFHDSPAAAEKLGFRACHRCHPKGAGLSEQHLAMVATVCRNIEAAEEPPTLRELAASVGLSPFHFHRIFRMVTGVTPKIYAAADRAARLRKALPKRKTVTEAIYEAGFSSSGRFYANSTKILGMRPKDYRRGGADESIRFALGECSLGSILVAASKKGICAIFMGDDPELLLHEFQDRFSKANLIGGDRAFEAWVAKVIGFFEAPGIGLDLPLDIRGTAFQQRVWQALREIPLGSTASYSEIAGRIGMPKAARAVAQACGANSIAVAIPCHRVLRSDRSISGYRWGVDRKRALLQREGVGK